jgi:hypothetical protein
MEPTVVSWIDSLVGAASGASVALLLLINGAFAAGVLLLRDRSFVNRWTKPLVVADAALLFAAVGTPIIGIAMRLGIRAFELVVSVPVALIAGK